MKRPQWRGKRHAYLKFQRKYGLHTSKKYLSSPFIVRGKHRGPPVVDPSVIHVVETSATYLFQEADCQLRVKKIGHLNEKGSVPW
ncbi:hypothetical protein pEaSNUABM11_00101 [Erwinia phage pEa_SNUABM_11]|nr:hypothetical protein pEaSNUABM11_00101 [Erwinia phage pEa_SNUABM_11]